ncbi:MAG: hypothetical protein KBF47_18560 [Gemmatimonadales bacterium]|nr:hypothetical protein [Gemmatimonadales bacterium]
MTVLPWYVAAVTWNTPTWNGTRQSVWILAGPCVEGVTVKTIVAARVLEEYPKATDIMVVALSERDLAELALQTIGVTPAELAAESEGSNT